MKSSSFQFQKPQKSYFLCFLLSAFCYFLSANKPMLAGTLYNNWNYAIDSFDDSTSGNDVGNTKYEIFGTAFQQTPTQLLFAINSNLSLEGTTSTYAADGHVGWGDLFLDLDGSLLGVKFVGNNASGVATTGLYDTVTTKTVAKENGSAWDNLGEYNNWVRQNGKTPSIGDLGADDPYFNLNEHVPNLIASGTRIGDVELIADLTGLGLDFGQFQATGAYTHVLAIDRTLLPAGNVKFWLAPECDNDITAHIGTLDPAPVPEPSLVLGLGGFALLLGRVKSRRS
ncbi:MAG: PEP-CTERM sorting domain-containing protein [Cyanobacteria bacterium J055]|nr:MAG: PEP-CTERM sorting domain-containing protein [Cyanobacteria bacterium J055]